MIDKKESNQIKKNKNSNPHKQAYFIIYFKMQKKKSTTTNILCAIIIHMDSHLAFTESQKRTQEIKKKKKNFLYSERKKA